MTQKKILFIFFSILLSISCEDILEEPDISNLTVDVFAPLENSVIVNNTVNFNWDTVDDARSYRIQIAEPDFVNTNQLVIDSTMVTDSLGFVSTQLQQTLLNGNYSWRVKAINGGFETEYATNDFVVEGDENIDLIEPNTPQLVAPATGTTQSQTTISFSWTREDIAGTAERDSIFFYEEETLTTLVSKDIGVNKEYTATLVSGTYYWFVKAYDTAGNESDASDTFNFTIN